MGIVIESVTDTRSLRDALGDRGYRPLARPTRTKDQKELYCLRRYLLTLADVNVLQFPLRVEKGETPDFVVSGAASFGIEVTEATDELDQREMTLAAQSQPEAFFQGQFGGRGRGGFYGDTPERLWRRYVEQAIERKRKLRFATSETRLLIYSNSNAGAHVSAEVAATLLTKKSFDETSASSRTFADVAILKGKHLICHAAGSPIIYPMSEV